MGIVILYRLISNKKSLDFSVEWIPSEISTFEPLDFGEYKEKTGSFEPAFPNVCTREESNLNYKLRKLMSYPLNDEC